MIAKAAVPEELTVELQTDSMKMDESVELKVEMAIGQTTMQGNGALVVANNYAGSMVGMKLNSEVSLVEISQVSMKRGHPNWLDYLYRSVNRD